LVRWGVAAYPLRECLVGWSMATHLRTEFVVDALQMAIASRKPTPPGLVHHSDRGVQYTSLSFGERLEDEELIPSMGRVSSLRHTLAESFVVTLMTELLYRASWPTRQAGRTPIFEYIEGSTTPAGGALLSAT
jgi:putative transposase